MAGKRYTAARAAVEEGTAAETSADEAPAVAIEPQSAGGADEDALAGVGVETTADEEIGALTEPVATDAVTPDGVPAGEALNADTQA